MPDKKHCLNMSCGQTSLYPESLLALSEQIYTPAHSESYFTMELECTEWLKQVLFTQNDVLLMIGTATYGIEAAILTLLDPGDPVLTVDTGGWGGLLRVVAENVDARVTEINLPQGTTVTPEQIREVLRKDPTIKMVGVAHVDTYAGTANPVDTIGLMLKAEFPDVVYLVDAVSSLAAMPLKVDEWGIDLCCTSPQKAVNAPQGLAIVSVSPKAWQVIDQRKTRMACGSLDLTEWRQYAYRSPWNLATWVDPDAELPEPPIFQYRTRNWVGVTLSYALVKALHAALGEIIKEGIEKVWQRHKVAAMALRAGARAMGLAPMGTDENCAWDAHCIHVPGQETFDAFTYRTMMLDDYGITGAGASATIRKDRNWPHYVGPRIGLMGQAASPEYVLPCLAALESTLIRMGYNIPRGVALPAAQAVFAAG